MRVIRRIIILFIIFCGSLIFFGSSMKDNSYSTEAKIVAFEETSLPVIFMRVNGCDINRLHGYSVNLDAFLMRETITPVMADQTLTVVISENDYDIRKVTYEITDISNGDKFEDGAVIALDKEDEYKTAKVKIKGALVSGREYALKITLISNESKRVYYYTRIMLSDASNLAEKLDFVDTFHNASLDNETAGTLKKYLETQRGADTTDYSYVDIHSGTNMLAYGSLNPEIIYQELPVITEYTKDTASVTLSYYMSMNTTSGTEYYKVKECYRFRYTSVRVYLYDYERYTEAIFDYRLVSPSKNEFKLGITGETDIEAEASPDGQLSVFVRSGTLWLYDYKNSQITNVFSFKQQNTDYFRDIYEAHDIKILDVDDDGSVEFMVYGYMNRGDYEGRTGIVFYRYLQENMSVTELAYIPLATTYEILKGDIGSFAYITEGQLLYFTAFDRLYSYNFVSDRLEILSEDVNDDTMYYSEAKEYVAWQEKSEGALFVNVLELESGTMYKHEAEGDGYIRLLGSIDENLIYGYVRADDVSYDNFGNGIYPAYKLRIASYNSGALKTYEKEGFYVTGVSVSGNVITLDRIKKNEKMYSGYEQAEQDNILNSVAVTTKPFMTNTRATDVMLKEYYLTLPAVVEMTGVPKLVNSRNIMAVNDTTVRITAPERADDIYYAYSFGEVISSGTDAGKVMAAADAGVGSMLDESGRVIWQRGSKKTKHEISGITKVSVSEELDSFMACVRMLCLYKNLDIVPGADLRSNGNITDSIEVYMKLQVMDLSGASLEEVLNFVSDNRPVIGMLSDNRAVLIYGYDSNYVTMYNPYTGKTLKMDLDEADEKFSECGNRFIGYIE